MEVRLQHAGITFPPGRQQELRDYYVGLLELDELDVPDAVADRGWVWFDTRDAGIELHFIPHEIEPDPGRRHHFCLQVDDLSALRRRLDEAGHETRDASGDIPGRARFFTSDPFGNLIEFIEIDTLS